MTDGPRNRAIRNLVSPYGLAAFSYFIFLVALVFPPKAYTDYIGEPDLMFLNLPTLAFYTVCVGAFMAGVYSVRYFGCAALTDKPPRISVRQPFFYLAIPLLISAFLCGIFLAKLGGHIDFIALLSSGQGEVVKVAMGGDTEGNWASALTLLTAVLWWAAFRGHQLQLKGFSRVIFLVSFLIAAGMDVITCVATVDRTNLMPLVAGLFVIYLFFKSREERVKIDRLALISAGSATGVIGAFLVVSFLRGASAGKLLVASLMGYTIVSYNRLTALVTGVMHYAYQGRAVYLFPLLVRNDRINDLIPMRDWFGWPDLLVQMESEFSAVLAAGLNGKYNWAGYFGYIYSDLGWWTPIYLLFLGVFTGFFWRRFCTGKTDGIIMYIWIAFSILFWVGGNWIFQEKIVRMGGAAILLAVYDRFSLRHEVESVPSPKLQAKALRERVI
jgi:hypothetical protein